MPEDDIIRYLMKESIEEAKKSVSEDQGIHPMVGAIIADKDGKILQRAHRGEVPGCHAEYLCIKKAKDNGQDLSDCIIFATLEPCTARGPGKKSCSKHILESGLKKVYIVPERKPRFFLSAAPGAISIQSTDSIFITLLS